MTRHVTKLIRLPARHERSEIRVFPAGLVATERGGFFLSAKEVMGSSDPLGRIGYGPLFPVLEHELAGTFRTFTRSEEVWARLVLGNAAAKRVDDREYRYAVAVFEAEASPTGARYVTRLRHLALTNVRARHQPGWVDDDAAPKQAPLASKVSTNSKEITMTRTIEGIEVPSDQELALINMTKEDYVKSRRRMIRNDRAEPEELSTGTTASTTMLAPQQPDAPSDAELNLLGMSREDYNRAASRMANRHGANQ
jgi:hypothetical protein